MDKTCRDANLALEAHKRQVQSRFSKELKFPPYQEGDLVLLYHPKDDLLEACMLQPKRLGPYVITEVLPLGAYELQD